MRLLITGAAGNLGAFLAGHLAGGRHHLNLMTHHRPLPEALAAAPNVSAYRADLGDAATLAEPCRDVDCIVHFAGRLFAPRPERFLAETNVRYVENLVGAALAARVSRFVLISFPHVEGESSPEHPAPGLLQGHPNSVHARTRLEAERRLFAACADGEMTPVVLRAGMIYGRGVLMIDAARWLMRRHLLGVWREPTWIHLLSLPDFLRCVVAAAEGDGVAGIYGLGDEAPLTLQAFLDRAAAHWGYGRPWRGPRWLFFLAATCVEAYARAFGTAAPLTRDFVRIGMASYTADTRQMRAELVDTLAYPSLDEGIALL